MAGLKDTKLARCLKFHGSINFTKLIHSLHVLAVFGFEECESKRLGIFITPEVQKVGDGDCDWFREVESGVVTNTDPEHW